MLSVIKNIDKMDGGGRKSKVIRDKDILQINWSLECKRKHGKKLIRMIKSLECLWILCKRQKKFLKIDHAGVELQGGYSKPVLYLLPIHLSADNNTLSLLYVNVPYPFLRLCTSNRIHFTLSSRGNLMTQSWHQKDCFSWPPRLVQNG